MLIYFEGELRKRYASFFTLTREDGRTTEDLQSDHLHRDDSLGDNDDSRYIGNDPSMDNDLGEEMGIVSDPAATVVHLAHASIGDFFRRDAGGITAGVGVDIKKARISTVQTCLSFWSDEKIWKKWESSTLANYAASYWPLHLNTIDLSTLSTIQKSEIGTHLIRTMRDEDLLQRWCAKSSQTTEQWACSDTYSSLAVKWFEDEDVLSGSNDDDLKWIASLRSNVDVVGNMTIVFATQWLKDIMWNPVECFIAVWNHIQKVRHPVPNNRLGKRRLIRVPLYVEQLNSVKDKADPSIQDLYLENLEPAAILEVARWAKFEENGLWHSRVAQVLRAGRHLDKAIEEYESGIKLDNKLGIVFCGLALCYSQKKEYEKAIETMQKAEEVLHADPEGALKYKWFLISTHGWMGDWYLNLKNSVLAFESYKKALNMGTKDVTVVVKILDMMHKKRRYQDMMDFLEELQANVLPETGVSRLVQFTPNAFPLADDHFFSITVHAAWATGRLDFIKENMHTSLKVARKSAKVGITGRLQHFLGLLTLRHFEDEARAIRLWEQIMETSFASTVISELGYARIMASIQLANHYFEKALAAGKGTSDCDMYIKKLESLSKRRASTKDEEEEESPYIYSTRDTTLVLGKLYQLMGEKEQAKECFKTHIKLGVDLLTDEDPENDWQGFTKLANVLGTASDDDHATTAYSLYSLILEDEGNVEDEDGGQDEEGKDKSDDAKGGGEIQPAQITKFGGGVTASTGNKSNEGAGEDEFEFGMACSCDGPCGIHRSKPDGFHICRMCIDIGFCDDCVKLVKDGTLPWIMCSAKHDFFHLPTATKRLPKGMVMYKGEEVEIGTWLKELRRDWNV